MKLVTCKPCKGTGEVVCCGGHMCTGMRKCYDCDGKGKRLSAKDRKQKEKLEKLMEYK